MAWGVKLAVAAATLALVALTSVACTNGSGASHNSATTASRTSTSSSQLPSKIQDTARAQNALLTAADLPTEWHKEHQSAERVVAEEFACFDLDQAGASAEAKGQFLAAGGPVLIMAGHVFNRGTHVVTSAVTVYGTEASARSAYQNRTYTLRTSSVAACLKDADTVAKGPSLDGVEAAFYLAEKFPHVGDEVQAVDYKIHFAKDKKSLIYVDAVVVRDGRAVGLALVSSIASPPATQPVSVQFVEDVATKFGGRLSQTATS